jgi:hypothetical protein
MQTPAFFESLSVAYNTEKPRNKTKQSHSNFSVTTLAYYLCCSAELLWPLLCVGMDFQSPLCLGHLGHSWMDSIYNL